MSENGKLLLSNFIRHAGTHNRIQEEKLMWQQRESELSRDDICPGWRERHPKRAPPLTRGHLVSDMGSSGERCDSEPAAYSHSPNYWTRKLMKVEESDPYRWGHGGYKEQHPDEFISSDEESRYSRHKRVGHERKHPRECDSSEAAESDTGASSSKKSKSKKRKRIRSSSSPLVKKRKKSKKEKKHQSTSKRKNRQKKLKTQRTAASDQLSASRDS